MCLLPGEVEVRESRLNLRNLVRRNLYEAFDDEGLRGLCFEMGIRYDDMGGEGYSGRVLSVIEYLEQRDRLDELIRLGAQERPHLYWGDGEVLSAQRDAAVVGRAPNERSMVYVSERQRPGAYKGLIVLISRGRADRDPLEQSAKDAIDYHAGRTPYQPAAALVHCWLIATPGTEGSQVFAEHFATYCRALGVQPHVEVVDEGFSIQGTYDLVRTIYAEARDVAGLAPEEIISDFTGSVKPMSVGMVLACGEQYPMQYMYGGKPPMASVPRALTFRAARLDA